MKYTPDHWKLGQSNRAKTEPLLTPGERRIFAKIIKQEAPQGKVDFEKEITELFGQDPFFEA